MRTPLLPWAAAGLLSLVTLLAATPGRAANAADARREAKLAAAEAGGRAATAELARLDHDPHVDSLAVADALLRLAQARIALTPRADSVGLDAARRGLALRERRFPARPIELAAAHEALAELLRRRPRDRTGEPHLERAIELRMAATPGGDSTAIEDWLSLAIRQRAHGEDAADHASLEQALAVAHHLWGPDHPMVALILTHLAIAEDHLGNGARSIELCQQAEAMYHRLGALDHPYRQFTLAILTDYVSGGDATSTALELRREALRVARVAFGEESGQALAALHNLGTMLMAFGDYAGARAVFEDVVPRGERAWGDESALTAHARLSLAQACGMTGDTARAARLFQQLEAVYRSHPFDAGFGLPMTLKEQAKILLAQGHFGEAAAEAQRAFRTCETSARPNDRMLTESSMVRIEALEALGDTAALRRAADTLAAVAASPFATGNLSSEVCYWRARAAAACGARDEARRLALAADSLARDAVALDARRLSEREALQLARQRGHALDLVAELEDAAGARVVWDRLVRIRGSVRAEIDARHLPLAWRGDTALVAAHGRWVAGQRGYARALVDWRADPHDSAAAAGAGAARTAAENAEAAYARALRTRGGARPVEEAGLADVQASLGARQALVGFLEFRTRAGANRLDAFVTRGPGGAVERIALGDADSLRDEIAAWRERLETPPAADPAAARRAEQACRRYGERVRARVWDPIAARLGDATEVDLVPDGAVTDLAWQALPAGDDRYLVERGPELHVLGAERERLSPAAPAAERSLLAVGAPNFDRAMAAAPVAVATGAAPSAAVLRGDPDICASGRRPVFEPLPGARLEIEAIARRWRARPGYEATTLEGDAATEDAFRRLAPGHAVLHLATHGFVTGDTCQRASAGSRGIGGVEPLTYAAHPGPGSRPGSGAPAAQGGPSPATSPWIDRRVWLALAGANHPPDAASGNNGFLTAEEVATLDLTGTDWVVLSACHSALAPDWARDGAQGMRRAFGIAGARSVIASGWAVEDLATREWMEALYAARARGVTNAARAVAAADRAVLAARRATRRSTHPFHWAAFGASGE